MRGSGRVEEYDNGRRALIRTSFVSMLAGMGIVVDPSYVELIIRAILASGVDFTGRRMQADEGVTITVQMTMPDSPPISVADIRSNFATPAVQNVVRSTLASVAGVTVTEMIVTAEPRESGGGLSGGAIAALVVVPLLIALIGGYWWWSKKQAGAVRVTATVSMEKSMQTSAAATP